MKYYENKKILKLVLLLTFMFSNLMHSQNIGINTESPDPSAMLHIESNNMGLLIPKVNISNLSSASPVSNPAIGLLVYNTNTITGPGFFFWNGTGWVSLFSKVDFDNTPAGGINSSNISNWNTAYSWGNHANAGYAASSHTHDASHIVSGTLSVSRGGTGLSSYTSGGYIYASGPTTLAQKTPAQVLSDIGAAPSSHTHATLSVGSYLTGGNYDGSTARTWAVDATSTNTANKIIARDASGAFAAGVISSDNLYVYNSASTGWAGFTSYRNAATGNTASDGSAVGINGTDLWINNFENARIFLGTQNTSRMVVLGNGNVGIGTDAPGQKLEVAGNIRTSGQLYSNGSISNYGAISIYGTKNNYGGINFRDGSGNNIATLMIHSQYQGVYNSTDNGWLWYWNNGTLAAGTVPVARISGLGNCATLNVGTTSGTVAAGDHTHANATTSAAGFMSAADKTKLDGIRKGSFVITKTSDGWHIVTHNWNISNLNWYAIAVNGDKSANNATVMYECAWRDANSCWVYLSGGINGNIRINIVAF